MTVSRMPKIRVSEITAFVVFTVTFGFLTALVFTALLVMAGNLRSFRFIMPDVLYDAAGEPRAWIEKTLPTVLVGAAAFLFILFGNFIGGVALGAAAAVDLLESRISWVDFVGKVLKK